ncbi:hypothetical protein BD31_I0164 [Candidatus Nitrosopumilus salaria BD31]|uniref:Uncharacterized protein n=1 Tax=Candidatus Nitrosopumilus salarius BD31 TaxID=859350 RepID=I3D2E3_9ARCH|nr:hypothetical protein BD31_I0164 [Candidatus Nitrosopumilus salaria BD31]
MRKFQLKFMTRDFAEDPSINGLLKMTNNILIKLKKEIQ